MRLRRILVIVSRNFTSDQKKGFLKIGDVRIAVKEAEKPERVPYGYASGSKESVPHLKWLLQKDLLNQDVFLIGPPGKNRSQLVLQYLELCNEEYEWLTVTRDSTESDIKQKRELKAGNAFYSDLSAVRAALHGRVLVIDGVEKAERNVLPILNNLLENREIQLDDGRFLMKWDKFDQLKQKYSESELRDMGVERVSERFRVVALGVPVPQFPGYPLDPPFRSRFQCRNVNDLGYEAMIALCTAQAPNVPSNSLNNLVSLVYALNSLEVLPFPFVPVGNLPRVMQIWNSLPSLSSHRVFNLLFPTQLILSDSELKRMQEYLNKFDVNQPTESWIGGIVGKKREQRKKSSTHFVSTDLHEDTLELLEKSLSSGDVFLVGAKGSGKSMIMLELCSRLGHSPRLLIAYQDMNSREFFQSRRISSNGDTTWADSPLVGAAKEGALCVIDGADRVHWSALSALSPLLFHRRVDLPDGTRLVGHEEWKEMREKTGSGEEELNQRGVFEIKPTFRLILMGESPSSESRWLNSAVLSLAPVMCMPTLSWREQEHIIRSLVPTVSDSSLSALLRVVSRLSTSHEPGLQGVAASLSLRRLVHLAKRDCLHQGQLRSLLERSTLARFFPQITKAAFNVVLDEEKIVDNEGVKMDLEEDVQWLRGKEEMSADDEAMVPSTLFHHNEHHMSILSDMARDFRLGEHLLLIGNQGVGKNKLTDRFLQLINKPRQYMQLHRDTTVESLTLQTKVEGGIVRFEDSPLVKAARSGHALVIDEADKASVHVIAVLKSLLDSGYLQLGDGRCIVPSSSASSSSSIPLHPSFRVIFLANRPGFPFLGNDLFGTIGDLCAIHVVENPSMAAEMQMLVQYAPDVPKDTLHKLVLVFSKLRNLSDEGILQYPYSTRELVNICKHLQNFPNDSLTQAIRNVFDFDSYSKDRLETVERVFREGGIPLGMGRAPVALAEGVSLPAEKVIGRWNLSGGPTEVEVSKSTCSLNWLPFRPSPVSVERSSIRGEVFKEESSQWSFPLSETMLATDVLSIGDRIIVAAVNPCALYVSGIDGNEGKMLDLSQVIRGSAKYEPILNMTAITDNLVLIHEHVNNELLILDVNEMCVASLSQGTLSKLFSNTEKWRLLNGERISLMKKDGMALLEWKDNTLHRTDIRFPNDVHNVIPLSANRYLVQYTDGEHGILRGEKGWQMTRIASTFLKDNELRTAFRSNDGRKVFFDVQGCYYGRSGFPLASDEDDLLVSRRPLISSFVDPRRPYHASEKNLADLNPHRNIVIADSVILRTCPRWATPVDQAGPSTFQVGGYIEAVDMAGQKVYYLPVPEPRRHSFSTNWIAKYSTTPFVISPMDHRKVLTVDTGGMVRMFEVDRTSLAESFQQWSNYLEGAESNDRIEFEKDDFDISKLDSPKIGKFDPANTPHVGGNTWAGGTGGYNTAGLGGIGGPFRLDAGHNVHQMSEVAKAKVPEHILKKAKEIAKAEYAKRLKEIQMSEYDAEAYESMWRRIEKEHDHLRNTIEQLEAKKKERIWSRNQTSGDFDETKLIEGIAGENNIYRRRVEKEPDPGAPMMKPKRLRVVMDVSGSMYRFNGYDKRLQRSLEAALLVMTSLEGQYAKVNYEITGHSGEGPYVPFVIKGNYPQNNKQRLDILKQMLAHTQFCSSGDFTIEALDEAKKSLSKDEDSDERIVLLLSDANLDRYGIRPKDLAKILERDDGVNAFIILIGSLGEQAVRIQKELPVGRAFVCTNTDQLPQIMQRVFDVTLQ